MLLSQIFTLTFIQGCVSFSYYTHGILGEMTKTYISEHYPQQFNKISNVTRNASFTEMSIWADKAKRTKEWSWTRKLHYIDILECNLENDIEKIIDKYCENKCITNALTNFTNNLQTQPFTIENFKFLLHFTQDFNQPMHLYGVYRGGNSLKVIRNKKGRNKTTNYHFLWDSEIPEYYIKNYNYKPSIQIVNFNSIDDYTKYIYSILKINMKMPCTNGFLDEYIIFEKYFNEESMNILFNNYMSMIINTFLFLF
jgi:hypothetical protein